MLKENKRFVIYISILFLSVLLSYPLPHRSLSTIQFLIPAIHYGNSTIFISGIIIIILFLIGVVGIISTRDYKRNKLVLVIIVAIIVPAIMSYMLDLTRTTYHTIKKDSVQSIDILESHISLNRVNDDFSVNIKLDLKNYNFHPNRFNIRVYLPKTLSIYTGITNFDFSDSYIIRHLNDSLSVNESFDVHVSDEAYNYLTASNWSNESVQYELYDENTTSTYIKYSY